MLPLHPGSRRGLGLAAGLALCALLASGPALALDPGQPVHRYAHEVWNRDTGLPSTSLSDLVQTRDGYIWLGTQDGLVRFDGERFTTFHSRNTPEIKNNNVQALLEDEQGALWFSTLGGGVVRLFEGSFRVWTSADGLSSDVVRALARTADGAMWIATERGLDRLEDGAISSWSLEQDLGDPVVERLYVDREDRLWVGSRAGGICLFRDGACHAPPLPADAQISSLRAMLQARDGSLWFGMEGAGLLQVRGEQLTRYGPLDGLSCTVVTALHEDRDGNIWAGTQRGGLDRLGPGGPEVFGTDEGLSHAHVTTLLEDREGSLWIGTFAGGLNRLREASFVNYGLRDGLGSEVVLSVLEDRLGYVWIGTMRGLFRMHGDRAVPFAGMDQVDDLAVVAMYQDRGGALWLGTYGQGLHRFADGEWTAYSEQDGLASRYVFAVTEDAQGRLWVGTQAGLNRMEGGSFLRWTHQQGLAHDTVRSLLLATDGTLWLGTDGGGVQRWSEEGFSAPMPGPDAAPNLRQIQTSMQSADGSLWFGTEGGLMRLDAGGDDPTVLTAADGLFDDRIWQVMEDEEGDIWLSCNQGVYRLQREQVDAFVAEAVDQVESDVFGRSDGMASSECNGGGQPAGTRTSDGRLWFPTTRGAAVIDPVLALREKPAPLVTVEAVLVDERVRNVHEPLQLEPGSWRVAFGYTAPFFVAPDKVRFRYQLEGQELSRPSTSREASYTNLAPGDYRFKVMASNGYGRWNEVGASKRFTVLPHYWQTGWFRALMALVGLLAVLIIYWARELRHRRVQQRLESQVDARTSELRRLAEKYEELSLRDQLTGLRNRRFLAESVQPLVSAISRQHANLATSRRNARRPTMADRMGVALLDIDHFKRVNDSHGHDAGDAVLRQLAQLLADTARGQDVVTRWGGEEFLVAVLGADQQGLAAFGERFRQRVEARSFTLPGGGTISCTCSVGLACCPFYAAGELGVGLDQLVALADLGLYHAKRSGRNRTVLVKPGLRPPTDRDEASRAFASLEAATDGGFVELEVLEDGDGR